MRTLRLAAAAAVALAALVPADGFVRLSSSSNQKDVCWDLDSNSQPELQNGQLTFRLHTSGAPGVPLADAHEALQRAFQAWEGEPRSRIAFVRGADTSVRSTEADDEFPVFWTVSGNIDQGTADPSDDVSIGGALGVAYNWWTTSQSGCEPGTNRLVDTAIALSDTLAWTTDPSQPGEGSKYDIEAVATHEIGHSIGLDHSPLCVSTMFPRGGAGSTIQRYPIEDDRAGVARMYPDGNWADNHGTIQGTLTKTGPVGVFGGSLVAVDSDGVAQVQTLSGVGGAYEIPGLAPGSYAVYAEPLDPTFASPNLFDELVLGGMWSGVDTSFQTTVDHMTTVFAGATTARDVAATSGGPSVNVYWVGKDGSWSNSGRTATRGGAQVRVGVAGAGVPSSGSPLSISGAGYTLSGSPSFPVISSDQGVEIRATFAADAALGPRSLVVTSGSARATAHGCLDVVDGFAGGVPGAVDDGTSGTTPLTVSKRNGRFELRWGREDGASFYHVYRGTFASLLAGSHDHTALPGGKNGHCYLSHPFDTVSDGFSDGVDYYFLVSAENDAGAGSLGSWAGGERPAPLSPCVLDADP